MVPNKNQRKPRWSNALRAKYRREGRDACENNKPINDNPYDVGSCEHFLWNDGHYNAINGEGHKRFMEIQSLLENQI